MQLQLKTRLSIVVWSAIVAISLLTALLLYVRDAAHERELRTVLMSGQKLAWERSRTALDERITAVLGQINHAQIAPWVASKDKDELLKVMPPASGIPVEVLDLERQPLFDSTADESMMMIRQPILTIAAAKEVVAGKVVAGLEHVTGKGFVVFRAQAIRLDSSVVGILVASAPISSLLSDLRFGLGGDVVLATLRGSRVTELGNNLLGSYQLPTTITSDEVFEGTGREQIPFRATVTLLNGWNDRPVAAMVNVQDMTLIQQGLQQITWMSISVAIFGGLIVALGVAAYLRAAFQPLEAAAQKLMRLASGDTAPDLDAVSNRRDEVGRIIDASEPLRIVVAENKILHEERIRVGQVQERMMIEAMSELASTLPAERRAEVLASIDDTGVGDTSTLTKLAKTLSNLTAQVTQAVQTREAHARMSRELEIASRLQHSVLPKDALRNAVLNTYATMIPAFEVGGDFYDYWMLDEHRLAVVIADVSGKGVPGALFMAITRTLLRASDRSELEASVAQFIEPINDFLSIDNDQAMFVTAWFGVLDFRTGAIRYVNAGHNPPVLMRKGECSYLEPAGNVALGAMDGLQFGERELQLDRDDVLVLYTDGVTEATSLDKQLFGEEALKQVLTNVELAARIPESIVAAIRVHEKGAPQADDITILAIHFNGPATSGA
jgi:phosphoserine phosphatase RsbU/P